ncbi:hypothetical protein TNCV_2941611 [Trichonephila clavipes]|nr:hypothetical protein TNCV_2941611 [Trichonephila clavipes]
MPAMIRYLDHWATVDLSCPLKENDLFEFMTASDDKKVDNNKIDGEVQVKTDSLIREDLKFDTRREQYFFTHDPDIEPASTDFV